MNFISRQNEQELVDLISDLRNGSSAQTENLLETLSRPLQPGPPPVKPFVLNFDVNIVKAKQLSKMPGE
jgi:hypothetical protein